MSELTRCNYCSLKDIRARAEKSSRTVTVLLGSRGGTDVFVHPSNVVIDGVDEDKRSEKLHEINSTIEQLEADKKAIQDELKSVGGMLPS